MTLLELLGIEPDTEEADRWTGLPHDLQVQLERTLDGLQKHGELRLMRSHWCYREGPDWRNAGSHEAGLLLARRGVVVMMSGPRMTLRPAATLQLLGVDGPRERLPGVTMPAPNVVRSEGDACPCCGNLPDAQGMCVCDLEEEIL